ncbi:hypothetical protein ACFUMH_05340 [Cellulomonas sp. NPDC057328]|uniref:hypothetical protein n=1 Tax=Cellulomonas sp. NPDC057328 TaxID=3346101 RepID=UPI0036293CDB
MAVDAWAAIGMFAGLVLVIVAGLRNRAVAWAREPGEAGAPGARDRTRWLRLTATVVGAVLAIGCCAVIVLGGLLGTGGVLGGGA